MTPKSGWENNTLIAEVGVIFAAIVILLSVLTRVWLVSKEHKINLKYWHTPILLQIFITDMDLMNWQ